MKNLKIGDKITRFPLIQGGMGVGISLGRLAGSVAKEGGIGIISTAQIGYRDPEFDKNPAQANIRAIESEMKRELLNELKRTSDPRVVGPDKELFDHFKRYSPIRDFPEPDWVK